MTSIDYDTDLIERNIEDKAIKFIQKFVTNLSIIKFSSSSILTATIKIVLVFFLANVSQ